MSELSDLLQQFSNALELSPIEVTILIFIVIVFLLLLIAPFIGYFRIIINIASFAYPVARVRAKGNPFIAMQNITRLAESKNVYELMEKVQNFGYRFDTHDAFSLEDVESMLHAQYVMEYKDLEATVPEGVEPFFRAYGMTIEGEELKAAIRAKHAGRPPDEITRQLLSIGSLSESLIQKLAEAGDMDDFLLVLQETSYGKLLLQAIPDYVKEHSTRPFELLIDRFGCQQLHASLTQIDTSLFAPLNLFVGIYSDILNILTLLRGKRDGLDAGTLQKYALPPGREITPEKLKQMSEARTVLEIVAQLDGTRYMSSMDRALLAYEETGSIGPFELALEGLLLDTALSLDTTDQYGPGPLIKFLVAKRYENQNIRGILWGIYEGASVDAIQKMAVCENVVAQ
jgi:vacuolar-type H+-ATPase subunit C/Vma6